MMGKTDTATDFGKTLGYCLEDKKQTHSQQETTKDRAEVLYYHQCYGNKKELARQFREVAKLNQNICKPVLHISLSLPPDEPLPKSKLVQLAKECAKDMDFEGHQYVVLLHKDTSHQHIHLVANRIGFDKHVHDNSFAYRKINEYCRAAELRHHLTRTLSPLRYRSEEERQIQRHDLKLDRLKENIRHSLLLSPDVAAFKAQMEERGYTVYQNEKGMAFMIDKYVVFRGYEAGYPFHKIQSILSQDLSLRQEEEKQRLEEELRLKLEQELSQREIQRHHQRHHSQQLSL
jgi:hypothetical protein